MARVGRLALLLGGLAVAAPALAAGGEAIPGLRWSEGLHHDVVILSSPTRPVPGARPVFPGAGTARLARWWRVDDPDAVRIGAALLASGRVDRAYLPSLPAPPPDDLPPETPDFREAQGWLDVGDGLGAPALAKFTPTPGAGLTVGDVEYGWLVGHEDLDGAPAVAAYGTNVGTYGYHGTSAWGIVVAGDNGYGVVGVAPEAATAGFVPYDVESGVYDLPGAIYAALDGLGPGDVLLLEQQAYCPDDDGYCPVEVEDAVFDAIVALVDAGVTVVEPAGNGGRDLDAPAFGDTFDRAVRDSGAILVAGGAPSGGGWTPRAWTGGSNHGARVDVQGWYVGIATTTNGDNGGAYADLYFPGDDPLQAYTSAFGGTSGASAMVAGVAAAAQGLAWAEWGEPWAPLALRGALVSTGTPPPDTEEALIGPLPDLRRLSRTYFR